MTTKYISIIRVVILAISILKFGILAPVYSADIEVIRSFSDPHLVDIRIRGLLERGDAAKISGLIERENLSGTIVDELELMSPGGLVSEGMEIGRTMRRLRIAAHAPIYEFSATGSFDSKILFCRETITRGTGIYYLIDDVRANPLAPYFLISSFVSSEDENCICASACAIAWLGALERSGTVSLHRSYLRPSPLDDSFSDYELTLAEGQELLVAYIQEMRVPPWVSDKIMSTSSSALYQIDRSESFSLQFDRVFEEHMLQSCRQFDLKSDERLNPFRLFFRESLEVDANYYTKDLGPTGAQYRDLLVCARNVRLQAASQAQLTRGK